MRCYPLTTNERAETGYTWAIEVTADDLTESTANTAQTLTTTIPIAAGDFCVSAGHYLTTPFKDASDSAFNTDTASIGDSVGGVATIYAALEMNVNGTEVLYKHVACSSTALSGFTSAAYVTVTFNSMSAKSLVNIDTGLVVFFIQLYKPSVLAGALEAGPLLTK